MVIRKLDLVQLKVLIDSLHIFPSSAVFEKQRILIFVHVIYHQVYGLIILEGI
jgi:hypothetical protein